MTSVGGVGTFEYDPDGNMISGAGRTIDFDLMDRAYRVTQGGTGTEFAHAPDGARYRQKVGASQTGPVDARYGAKTVYYVDKAYELVVWADGAKEERTYVGATVLYRQNGGAWQERYQHLDRLGSVDAVTDASGALVSRDLHGYDAFGKPRGPMWTSSEDRLHPTGDRGATTDRGFTGHEHLDAHQLIHMNGRVYDYQLGRFLSVDPIISNAADSQSMNPYSYIGNNPLSGVDPTGYAAECVKTTGSNACNANPIGNLTINGTQIPNNVVSGPTSAKPTACSGSGATPQGAWTPTANPAEHGSPPNTAKAGGEFKLKTGGEYADAVDWWVDSGTHNWQWSDSAFQPFLVVPGAGLKLLTDTLRLGEGTAAAFFDPELSPLQRVLSVAGDVGRASGVGGALLKALGPLGRAAGATGPLLTDLLIRGGQGFQSFRAFKRAMGPAGPEMQWHHIVEQTPGNVARFGAEAVHNTQNLIRLDASVHRQVSAYYSRIRPGTGGLTARQWLSTQPLEAQMQFGHQILRDFGAIP